MDHIVWCIEMNEVCYKHKYYPVNTERKSMWQYDSGWYYTRTLLTRISRIQKQDLNTRADDNDSNYAKYMWVLICMLIWSVSYTNLD